MEHRVLTSDRYAHAKSASELEHSSARGCHLCTILWQELNDISHYGALTAQEIRLKKLNFLATVRDLRIDVTWLIDAAGEERYQFQAFDYRNERLALLDLSDLSATSAKSTALSRSARTDAEHWLEFVKNALTMCISSHPSCQAKITDPDHGPHRLLDLTNALDENIVRLIDTSQHPVTQYIALSYCWGSAPALKLTSETEAALRDGISLSAFPRTVRDAIRVALDLDVPFLWVDASCIFQDSISDWEAEAKNVLATYSNSFLTIAATGAASCDEGLFSMRDPFLYLPCPAATLVDGTNLYAAVSFSPVLSWHSYTALHGRGWVVQERYLAPRTINFGVSIVWECRESLISDCTIRDVELGQQDQRRRFAALATSQLSPDETREARRFRLMKLWYIMLGQYTSSALSYRSDRIAAILGIMSSFQEHLCLTPWFGLWKPLTIWDLMWSASISFYNDASKDRGLEFNNFPSWTWARLNLEVTYELLPYQAPYKDIVYEADLASTSSCSCESHNIGCTERSITVSTRIVHVGLGGTPGQPTLPCITAIDGDSIEDLRVSIVWEDDRLNRDEPQQFLILVVRHDTKLNWRCGGLLVKPITSESHDERFERVGFADFEISEPQWQRVRKTAEKTVALV